MAVDYETLQAQAESLPPAIAPYCPECGRPWGEAAESARSAAPFPRGAVPLALVCLLVLAMYLDLVALQLSLGVPLAPETLDRAADDAVTIISVATGA
jgi:hypothetical protein